MICFVALHVKLYYEPSSNVTLITHQTVSKSRFWPVAVWLSQASATDHNNRHTRCSVRYTLKPSEMDPSNHELNRITNFKKGSILRLQCASCLRELLGGRNRHARAGGDELGQEYLQLVDGDVGHHHHVRDVPCRCHSRVSSSAAVTRASCMRLIDRLIRSRFLQLPNPELAHRSCAID